MRSHIRRLLFEQAGFTPRQLFSALQGAWYEPTTDTCFTDTAGTTPATLGQAIARVNDRSGRANNATQSTSANRPLLSARYNLLTKTEDFSDAVWTTGFLSGGTRTNGTVRLTNSEGYAYISQASVSIPAGAYTLTVDAVCNQTVSDVPVRIISPGAVSQLVSFVAGVTKRIIFNSTSTTDVIGFQIGIDARNAVVPGGSDATGYTITFNRIDLRLASTPASYPAYQRVNTATDYDTTGFPVRLVHDANDVLTASLPVINVRRNLLTYSEQFDNGAWTPERIKVSTNATTITTPIGFDAADAFIETSTPGTHRISQAITSAVGATYRLSVYIQAAGRDWCALQLATGFTNSPYAYFDLANGVVGNTSGSPSATILPAGNGWYRCSIQATGTGAAGIVYVFLASANGTLSFAGDASKGIYVYGAQLELGSTATPYQKITDWTSEAYSSSGSTYFATPQGMSSLHNQSMAATYNIPALSSDIYGWVITPERLSAVQESRLALYMQQKAGIAGPDYFEQEDYGPELVTNGTFDTNTNGWTASVLGGGTFTATGGVATQSSSNTDYAVQSFATVVGKTYALTGTIKSGSTAAGFLAIRKSDDSNVSSNVVTAVGGSIPNPFVDITATAYFKATASTTYVGIQGNGSHVVSVDNISVRELKDGVTGQLTDDAGDLIFTAQ